MQRVSFRARAYEISSELMECYVTRSYGASILLYVTLNACANVEMGAVIVGYGVIMYGR